MSEKQKMNQKKPVRKGQTKTPGSASRKNTSGKSDFSLNIPGLEEKNKYKQTPGARESYGKKNQSFVADKKEAPSGRSKEMFERAADRARKSSSQGTATAAAGSTRRSSSQSGAATATGSARRSGGRGTKMTASGHTARATSAGSTANRSAGASATEPRSNRRRSAVQRRRQEREIQRRRNRRRFGCFGLIVVAILCIVFGVSIVKSHIGGGKKQEAQVTEKKGNTKEKSKKEKKQKDKKKAEKATEASTQAKVEEQMKDIQEIVAKADRMAAGYDYDGAINLIKGIEGYDANEDLAKRVTTWETTKKNLVEFRASDVTHIFYHTLVVDPELAFECEPSIAEGFKEWMTTVREFNNITQKMYDNGYVLVSLYDFFEETYDSNKKPHFKEKSVYLPQGKKPFVLSLDDLSYYHTYTGHGMATRLIIGDDGKITCEYKERDGSVSVGSYDCVPLLNEFMDKHPDGAYHEARGTIALTGYNGVFGYRTDMSYVTREDLDKDKVEWLDAHPDFDHDHEVAEAKKIAEELKAEGWDFASHTWGHIRIGNSNMDRIKRDTEKWLKNVKPIIGNTECIIFAHGQDLSPYDEYDTKTNKKYQYLNSKGFHIYLNVDSHQKTMAVHDEYIHGGRRNLDGYRLWSDAHGKSDWTSDLFVASEMLDPRRKDVPIPKE
ncbi:MAG: polysaccharide deacetylase [Eubacteriales bacterium]|nr:polysaccharide deacetylase [Eubacteriales bacterium]